MVKYKGWINETFCYDISAESRGQAYGMLLRHASDLLKKGFRVQSMDLVVEKVEKRRKQEKTEGYEGQLSYLVNNEW